MSFRPYNAGYIERGCKISPLITLPGVAWPLIPHVSFEQLAGSDLHVDAIYEGGSAGNRGDDPLHPLLGVGNAGGFRVSGSVVDKTVRYAVLYSSGGDPDWPDVLDPSTGSFTYHGDQKTPGKDLHDTPRKGNLFLRDMFAAAGEGQQGRQMVPPLFLFEKAGRGTDVIFRGLLAPGGPGVRPDEQLVAAWRSRSGARYQNYRATFSVLDAATVPRAWIADLQDGVTSLVGAPGAWRDWVVGGSYRVLAAVPALEHRSREQQLPQTQFDKRLLQAVVAHFASSPTDFEACAAKLWQMMAPASEITEVTRASVDGGRDAIGVYSLGPREDPIKLSFSLEAKCFAPNTSVRTPHVARLISRLKHREFGVFVTTSYVDRQAYQELRADKHPVVVICGADIVRLLKSAGYASEDSLRKWLVTEFPV